MARISISRFVVGLCLMIINEGAQLAALDTLKERSDNQLPVDLPEEVLQQFYKKPMAVDQDISGRANEGPNVEVWPSRNSNMGQVSGIAVDSNDDVHVFHRGSRKWTEKSFNDNNEFAQRKIGPIKEATHIVFDHNSGEKTLENWSDMFYLPHGMTIDSDDNIWVTDVALHQVFKFAPGSKEPSLVLGEQFRPGSDADHFCKPTDVAVSAHSGEFFVADGYCNSRIMKFFPDGTFVTEFGFGSAKINRPYPPGSLAIPHSLTLIEDWNVVCVADREHERIQCFAAGLDTGEARTLATGTFMRKAENLGRVFAIRSVGHFLVGVTNTFGRTNLFVVNMNNGDSQTYDLGFENPHDLTIAKDETIYVGEIGPNRVLKIRI